MTTDTYSFVNIRETKSRVKVKIQSSAKPEIVDEVITKWQDLLNMMAKISNVPSGLIMKLNENTIEVFMKSDTPGNPYEVGAKEGLDYGLYCETVIGKQEHLLVADATKNALWKTNNPDIDINMISYLGFPLNWPDGEVFGTVCILDGKENKFSDDHYELLKSVKSTLETDLKLLLAQMQLRERNEELEKSNEQKAKFLSILSHDLRGGLGTLNEFMKLILRDKERFNPDLTWDTLETLGSNTNSLYETLISMLTWSKSELHGMQVKKEEVLFETLINDVVKFLKPKASLKNISLELDIDKNLSAIVDRKMYETIIRNILSNALKFTPDNGAISISLKKIWMGRFLRYQITDQEWSRI